MMMRMVIAGGGTGGHLFPGIAVAESFLAQDPMNEVLFVGTARGIEARIIPQEGYSLELIKVSGLKGKGIIQKIKGLWALPNALFQSLSLLRRFKAEAVLGVGGYASGPVLLAAWLLRIPTAVCEQNSVPGLTNRILGKLVKKVYGTFGHAEQYFSNEKFNLVGNPMRMQLVKAYEQDSVSTQEISSVPRLLILGGSQGARALNQVVPKALKILREGGATFTGVHQCGERDLSEVQKTYKDSGLNVEVKAFIKDMVDTYLHTDIALTRAGASTCTEVALMGVPTIMVPFPFATDDHQTLNARELEKVQGVKLLPEKEMTPERLAQELKTLLEDIHIRKEMTQNLKRVAKPYAANEIAQAAIIGFAKP
jgi:UDP-N-acetylglucosamine--N-acetylmuramyl-(pentapeptide) pyrophosphoryl-undecaprenol N-acetylglucosamine transferase